MERKEEKEREEGGWGIKEEEKKGEEEGEREGGGGGKGRMRMRPGGSKLTEFFILQTQTFQHFKPFVNLGRMYRYTLFLATHTHQGSMCHAHQHTCTALCRNREKEFFKAE